MGGKCFLRQKPLTIPQQAWKMHSRWPGFTYKAESTAAGIWTGDLWPTALSDTYRIQVRYILGFNPKTYVLAPSLRTISDVEKIPHRYPDGSLCLYQPKYGEWSGQRFISDTIIPWASLWLAHYEYWLATGEWHGGGEHPGE
jgi:hypothetical protein